jgi:hypothetical protein
MARQAKQTNPNASSFILLRLAAPLSKPERLAGALLLILFPPFQTLCRTRFDVYEEAAAYMYLTGIALFAAMLGFARRPTARRYATLGLLSGLVAFVRPTLWSRPTTVSMSIS